MCMYMYIYIYIYIHTYYLARSSCNVNIREFRDVVFEDVVFDNDYVTPC